MASLRWLTTERCWREQEVWRAWRGSGLSYWRSTKTARRTTDAGTGLAPLPGEARKKEGIEGDGRCGKMGALREGEGEIERGDRAGLSLARCMRVWVAAEGNERG